MSKSSKYFFRPKADYRRKHGNFYCAFCNYRGPASIPYYPRSVLNRREFACCSAHEDVAKEQIDIFLKGTAVDVPQTEADYSISSMLNE